MDTGVEIYIFSHYTTGIVVLFHLKIHYSILMFLTFSNLTVSNLSNFTICLFSGTLLVVLLHQVYTATFSTCLCMITCCQGWCHLMWHLATLIMKLAKCASNIDNTVSVPTKRHISCQNKI